jgi:SAM-dependent methyltransferase
MTDPPVVGASDRIREFWDADASTYDATKSHSISDPLERAAWRQALSEALPQPPASVLDIGAGTGSLSLLAAELGYAVTALDLSPGMLAEAERKANAIGLANRITYVVGSGSEPPSGPFDVVVERHVLWTIPDPVGALRSWLDVGRRLVLFEGTWGSRRLDHRAKEFAAQTLRKVMRTPPDHHAPYPEDVLAELPLARLPSPVPLVEAVHQAGWHGVRIRRLRDVEWAARLREPWPFGWLEELPRYVIVADGES